MDETLRSLLNWSAVWIVAIGLMVFLLNYYMQGFFIKYFIVKASRGKKVMVNVEALADNYQSVGKLTDDWLLYKKRYSKDWGRINITDKNSVYRSLGINWIDVHESLNAVLKPDWKGTTGFDAEKIQILYNKCLYKPSLKQDKNKIILWLLIACLIGLVIVGVMTYQSYKHVLSLGVI